MFISSKKVDVLALSFKLVCNKSQHQPRWYCEFWHSEFKKRMRMVRSISQRVKEEFCSLAQAGGTFLPWVPVPEWRCDPEHTSDMSCSTTPALFSHLPVFSISNHFSGPFFGLGHPKDLLYNIPNFCVLRKRWNNPRGNKEYSHPADLERNNWNKIRIIHGWQWCHCSPSHLFPK